MLCMQLPVAFLRCWYAEAKDQHAFTLSISASAQQTDQIPNISYTYMLSAAQVLPCAAKMQD